MDIVPMFFAQVEIMNPNLYAATVALMGVLGAFWLAVAYYTGNAMRKAADTNRLKRNASLIFVRSAIPAPVCALFCVAILSKTAPMTAGDYRFEWAVAFGAGTVATSIVKRLGAKAMSLAEEKP